MERRKIFSLQVLRAIAVTLVVFIHVINYSIAHSAKQPVMGSFYNLKYWGAIGVDLFFVISGFIMSVVVPSYFGNDGVKLFFTKRISRIIPLYYLFGAFATAIAVYKHKFALNIFIKTFIFLPLFDIKKFIIPFIDVGWSLSYEMYFYLLIAMLLAFKRKIFWIILPLIFALSAVGILFNFQSVIIRFVTSPLLLEFGLGIICGLVYKHLVTRVLSGSSYKYLFMFVMIAGLALMTGSIFWGFKDVYMQDVIENDNQSALYRAIIWGVPCAMFLFGVVMFEHCTSLKFPSLLIKAGDASYSCYLVHGYLYPIFFKIFNGPLRLLGPDFLVIADIVLCIGASLLFYQHVERAVVRFTDRLFIKSSNTPVL
jgi:exopolysaccharide production protein ExoZ